MIPLTFTCPRCRRTSHHPEDVRVGYCGNCHTWTGWMPRDYEAVINALAVVSQGPRR